MAVVCVGAVYIDIILNVPRFPIEDQKLRASSHNRRRGGNCANTLEVLAQLIDIGEAQNGLPQTHRNDTPLFLLSVLPNKDSTAFKFIYDSLPKVALETLCICRPDASEAASSYILNNQQNGSRTIVSHNPLAEMTLQEFKQMANILRSKGVNEGWFHFEGRIPEVTVGCVETLRKDQEFKRFKISVECEKPERTGMMEAARLADVVFYSKIWAEYYGYTSARSFLEMQTENTREDALLFCTWGAGGAIAVQKLPGGKDIWAEVKAWTPEDSAKQVVDAIGAGDTFIAAAIFHSIARENIDQATLNERLAFANEMAGRKVYQEGFTDLAKQFMDAHKEPDEPSLHSRPLEIRRRQSSPSQ